MTTEQTRQSEKMTTLGHWASILNTVVLVVLGFLGQHFVAQIDDNTRTIQKNDRAIGVLQVESSNAKTTLEDIRREVRVIRQAVQDVRELVIKRNAEQK